METESAFDADPETPWSRLGVRFAKALVSGDFEHAHAMLGSTLRALVSSANLERSFCEHFSHLERPLSLIRVAGSLDATELDSGRAEDIGFAYLTIHGQNTFNAFQIVVAKTDESLVIVELEWGRP